MRMDRTQTHRYFFFSVTIANVSYSDNAEWMLNEGATYHVCPNRDWFSNFKKLDGCFTVMGDDHPCNVEGMGRVRIKTDDGVARIEGNEVCTLTQKESYLCWLFENIGSCISIEMLFSR